jgi:hypothetical protein
MKQAVVMNGSLRALAVKISAHIADHFFCHRKVRSRKSLCGLVPYARIYLLQVFRARFLLLVVLDRGLKWQGSGAGGRLVAL